MKHLEDMEPQLNEWLEALGIHLSRNNLGLVLRHLAWLLEANKTLNLTAITDPIEALRLHLVDSLSAIAEVDSGPEGRLLDIGTGGGFPGLPLALASGREAVLLDSVRKKAAAVESFVAREGLSGQISVCGLRAEELALEHPASFAVVTARAVAELPALVELAAPLLDASGILVTLKARIDDEELKRGDTVAAIVGLKRNSIRTLKLPGGGEDRTVITFERMGASSASLPRRIGMAQKRPMA